MNPRLPDVNLLVVLACGVVAFLALVALLVDDVVKIRAEALSPCESCASTTVRHRPSCTRMAGQALQAEAAAIRAAAPAVQAALDEITMECPDCYFSGQVCPEHAEVSA